MKTTEKILLGLCGFSGLALSIVAAREMSASFILLALYYLWVVTACIYYMVRLKWSIYHIVLLLFSVGFVGEYFQFRHLPGSTELMMVKSLGNAVLLILIVRYLLINGSFAGRYYLLMLLAPIITELLPLVIQDFNSFFLTAGIYAWVAILGSIKFSNISFNDPLDALFNIILLVNVVYIAGSTLETIL